MNKVVANSLTRSDRQMIAAYADTRSITEAGIRWAELRGKTYANRETAASKGSRKLSEVRRKIEQSGDPEAFWEALGIGMQRIGQTLSRNLDATVTRPMLTKEGVLVEAGPYPDGAVQVKAAETAARLRGDLKRAESTTITAGVKGDGFQFIFMVDEK